MTTPSNTFTTRDGHAIALKPWHADQIAANITNFLTFIQGWGTLLSDTGVNPSALTGALPALKASLQDPAEIDRVVGLAELTRLARAVWDYNEIGVGMGEALALHVQMMRDVAGSSGGAATVQD
ncbi:hypothetical protein DM785_02680 [Deinococcus actinosclerus]|nr:hypothetical protein DM785_02680 [Deinococcus actinosclerus]